jgi:hypothetical protein
VALDAKRTIGLNESPNITDHTAEELRATTGQCVVIDPNRGDLLFCMHENSTPEEPFVMRYTKKEYSGQTKKRKEISPDKGVQEAAVS